MNRDGKEPQTRVDPDTTVTLEPNQPPAAPPSFRIRGRSNPVRVRPSSEPLWSILPGPDWPRDPEGESNLEGLPPRYRFGREIGRGGQGRILTVFDTELGRPVAVKTILAGPNATDDTVRRFIQEVQVTGQLEHPNIIPVHEMGRMEQGEIFYSMKLVEGRTLAEVIHLLSIGDASTQQELGPVRLVTILQQICQGVAFANARGVVHRDLKPSNIMLGDYGEVTVMDWGCAKVRGLSGVEGSSGLRPVITERSATNDSTVMGSVQGTPAYMAPEQAAGETSRIDARTDVYALGAILYELLTLHPPVEGADVSAKLAAVQNDPIIPPRKRAPDKNVSQELEEICMCCLAREPSARYDSALELHAALEAYLEGSLAQERHKRVARAMIGAGIHAVERLGILDTALEKLREKDHALSRQIEPWEPADRKAPLWRCGRKVEQVQRKRIALFGEAVKIFHQALSHDPQNRDARAALAALYWQQFQAAEHRGDRADMLYFEDLVKEFDDGAFHTALKGDGWLSIHTRPAGARVRVCRYTLSNQRLVPSRGRKLGPTPVRRLRLGLGSYLVVCTLEGHRTTQVPVAIHRQQSVEVDVRLLPEDALPDHYVHIPAGAFIMGGDSQVPVGSVHQQVWLEDFAISRFPVTCAQYLEFLNDLAKTDPDRALAHCPRPGDSLAYYWNLGDDNRFYLPKHQTHLGRWSPQWPVHSVSWEDAQAYCAWRSSVEGCAVVLPSEAEWEKAGRGVDGRYFPWGDAFDPSFCKMRESSEFAAQPKDVGASETDESPFGVRDMAGGIAEWCRDWFNPKQALRLVKGGGWKSTRPRCRLVRRHGEHFRDVSCGLGFRIVRSIPPYEVGS